MAATCRILSSRASPALSACRQCPAATATWSSSMRARRRVWSRVGSAWRRMPAWLAGTANRRSAPASSRVATISRSALAPSSTASYIPSRRQPSPSRVACGCSASCQPLRLSRKARVAVRLPAASSGSQCWRSASLSPSSSAGVARQALAKNGEQSRWLPICSSRIACSTKPRPTPPYCSGIISPGQHSSSAICRHSCASKPCGLAMAARTAAESEAAARKPAALSWIINCSSLSAKSITGSSGPLAGLECARRVVGGNPRNGLGAAQTGAVWGRIHSPAWPRSGE
ncbi:hypothetical protein D3C84_686600 [compost metagenome]